MDLPAGPELDRLIAEKVMGWVAEFRPTEPPKYVAYARRDDPTWYRAVEDWQPSTNIAHAWEVIEKLRANGVELGLLPDGDGWVCGWSDAASHVMWYESILYQAEGTWCRADSPALAICCAALRVIAA